MIPYGARFANAISSYVLYLWKTFWPSWFAVFYPHQFAQDLGVPLEPGAWVLVLVSLLLLIAASLLVWWQRRTRPYLVTGWLWYLGTLVPVIGIIQVGEQGMADRYAYVPLIGIFVIVVFGGAEIGAAARSASRRPTGAGGGNPGYSGISHFSPGGLLENQPGSMGRTPWR